MAGTCSTSLSYPSVPLLILSVSRAQLSRDNDSDDQGPFIPSSEADFGDGVQDEWQYGMDEDSE